MDINDITLKYNLMIINKDNLNSFRRDFNNLMVSLKNKYDVEIELGRINYGLDDFTSKIIVKRIPKNGKTIEQNDFDKNCHLYNLTPSDYGELRTLNNKNVKLIGFNLNSRKNNIQIKCINTNKIYNTSLINFKIHGVKIEEL